MTRWLSNGSQKILPTILAIVSVVGIASVLVLTWNAQNRRQAKFVDPIPSVPIKRLDGVPELDANTQEFNLQTSAIAKTEESLRAALANLEPGS